jgi:hypothetical protein
MAEVEDETPMDTQSESVLAHTERIFLRLTLLQTVLSVAGVFIAVVALYAALTESSAVRQQTAAAVWPFVQFATEDSDSGESAAFTMYFTNTGVGPARMRTMRLAIDGEPIRDWDHAVTLFGGQLADHVSRNFVSNRILSPHEKVVAFSTTEPDLARRFRASVANSGSFIAFCYCSIFDECWLADSRIDLQNPEAVKNCPDFGDATFRD